MMTNERNIEWTVEQRDALEREYQRIGFIKNARIPFPDPPLTPQEFLALLRSIPDSGAMPEYLAALQRKARR